MFTQNITAAQQALQLMALSAAVSRSSTNVENAIAPRPAVASSKPFNGVSISAINAIMDLKKGVKTSPEEEAMARVKGWVSEGLFKDAANRRDDLALRQLAYEGKLDNLPALSAEQERRLTSAELRVYSQARFLKTHFDLQPRTLEQAKAEYIKMKLSSLPEAITRITSALTSGELQDIDENWSAVLSEMKNELAAVKSGEFHIERIDPSLYQITGSFETVRDGNGLVIGNTVPEMSINNELRSRYAGKFANFGYNDYIGAYVISRR